MAADNVSDNVPDSAPAEVADKTAERRARFAKAAGAPAPAPTQMDEATMARIEELKSKIVARDEPVVVPDKYKKGMNTIQAFTDKFALDETAVLNAGITAHGRTATGFTSNDAVIHFVPIAARYTEEELNAINTMQQAVMNPRQQGISLETLANFRASKSVDRPRMDTILESAREIRKEHLESTGGETFAPDEHAKQFETVLNTIKAQYNEQASKSPLLQPIEGNLAKSENGTLFVNLDKLKILQEAVPNLSEVLQQQATEYSVGYALKGVEQQLRNNVNVIEQVKAATDNTLAGAQHSIESERAAPVIPQQNSPFSGQQGGSFVERATAETQGKGFAGKVQSDIRIGFSR